MTIGERIQEARKQAGMKQSELAEKLGVAVITIGQYERDKRQPRLEQLKTIAAALGVQVVDLLGPYDGPPLPGLVDGDKMEEVPPVKIPVSFKGSATLHGLARAKTRINAAVDQMTTEGQGKVADYAEDILPRYRAETAPESASAPQEGKDTTPPSDAPETPPEGK